MLCPRLHGQLETFDLSSEFGKRSPVLLCPDCHATWFSAETAKTYLDLDYQRVLPRLYQAFLDLPCPACQSVMKLVRITDLVTIYCCNQCKSFFCDKAQLALLAFSKLEFDYNKNSGLAKSPLDKLGLSCCDCNTDINKLNDLALSPLGYCCKRCENTPPLLSDMKLQNVQLLTFRGMEVKIDYWRSLGTCEIDATPTEPGLLNVELHSLSWPEKLLRFGTRRLALRGKLRQNLDASEGIQFKTPWQLFLKQRGSIACIKELVDLGSLEIIFKPHILAFKLKGDRVGADTRIRFEATVRRMLIVYEAFVKLTHRYDDPNQHAEDKP